MATQQRYENCKNTEVSRIFSEALKRKLVSEIEKKLITIAEVSREYHVSKTSIHRWLHKFSSMRKKKVKLVLESDSDTRKVQELKSKVKELERIIGQKQILLDFQEKMIEIASDEVGFDLKKKYVTQAFYGSGERDKSTDTK